MDVKTARSLEAKAVQRIAEKHGVIDDRLAAIEAMLAELIARPAAPAPAPATTSKKGA